MRPSYPIPVLGAIALAAAALVTIPVHVSASEPPIVLIVMENHHLSQVTSDPADMPYQNQLWNHTAPGVASLDITDYTQTCYGSSCGGSMPNYEDITTGNHQQTRDTPALGEDTDPSIFGQLSAAGIPWNAREEAIAGPCSGAGPVNDLTVTNGQYVMRHDPALLMADVWDNRAACRTQVIPLGSLAGATLPPFTFITPNLCNDMHGLPAGAGDPFQNCVTGSSALEQRSDAWLAAVVPQLVADGAVVLITYDEGDAGPPPAPLFTVVAGAAGGPVTNGSFTAPTSHYGMLAGIENALGLPLLGNAATATAVPVP